MKKDRSQKDFILWGEKHAKVPGAKVCYNASGSFSEIGYVGSREVACPYGFAGLAL